MVERTIKECDLPPTRKQLWNALSSKVTHQAFNQVIDYLDASEKIISDKNHRLVWVAADTPELKAFLQKGSKTSLIFSHLRIYEECKHLIHAYNLDSLE